MHRKGKVRINDFLFLLLLCLWKKNIKRIIIIVPDPELVQVSFR